MKRLIFYLFGLILLTLGVTSIIASELGASAWDSFFVGLSNTFGFTPGIWIIFISSKIMLLNAYLLKAKVEFLAFITVVIQGLLIDFWLLSIFSQFAPVGLVNQSLLFSFGVLAVVLGIGTYLQANFATDPIDNLMLAIHQKFKLSISQSRLLCEIVALSLAALLSGPIFIGTFIFTLAAGPLIQFSQVFMMRLYSKIS